MSNSGSLEKGQEGAYLNRAITPGGHALDNSQPAFPVYHRKLANPAPLGLSAFALTTFVLSLINLKTHGVVTPNIVVSLALGYGGLVQLLAGMWEFACGNTFGATAFSSYGGFWISYGLLVSPWSGIGAAYTNKAEFTTAVGFFLTGWAIFTFIMLIAALRSSVALVAVFSTLTMAFVLLAAEHFVTTPSVVYALAQGGGGFGIICAFLAWYTAATGLMCDDTTIFVLPSGSLAKRD